MANTGDIKYSGTWTPRNTSTSASASAYWLDRLVEAEILAPPKLQPLHVECDELTAIFVTIIKRARESA
jgi:hypothetical protein